MRNCRDLQVWQLAHRLAMDVYAATQNFPRQEAFGLTSQMRRAATSIPSNIAEGCGRAGNVELSHFLQIARASASELEYQAFLAHYLSMLADPIYKSLSSRITDVEKVLVAYRRQVDSGKKASAKTL